MKKLIFSQSILTNLSLLAFILRLTLGIIFFAHGAQKVLGWYEGFGLKGTVGWMNSELGIPVFLAYISCFAEFIGGIFLIIGFLTRICAGALVINMLVAMLTAHSGFFNPDGIEFPLSLMTLALASFLAGPGKFSADSNIT